MLLARAYIGAHEDFKAINILKSSETLDNTGEVAYLLGLAYFLLGRACQHAGDTAQATEWIAKLKDLKRKHEREDAAAVSDSKPVTSSTLLRGAPVTTVQIEGP
jgi:hypothetical protein